MSHPSAAPGSVPAPRNRRPRSISVVVPCYNEEEVLQSLVNRLCAALFPLELPFEIILVDDGSKDSTWAMMRDFQERTPQLKVMRLSHNRGQQIALSSGLDQSQGEVTVIMDADLQDPPELIGQMVELWARGYDVVYGQRTSRAGESAMKRFLSHSFYRLFVKITGFEIPADTGDFRLMDRRAVDALQSLREKHRFIRGMVSWIGFHQTALPYQRPKRAAGTTKFPFWKSLDLALDGVVSFSTAPLRYVFLLGCALVALSFLPILCIVLGTVFGHEFSAATLIFYGLFFLGSVQLAAIGLIGEYAGRAFEQSQRRPLYLIDEMHGEPLSAEAATRTTPHRDKMIC
ncbi:MAG: glycosyltransferase family 2 protein [Bdellovibrionota bacterium]